MLSSSACSVKSRFLSLAPPPTTHRNFHKRFLCKFRRHWSTLARARAIIDSSPGPSAMESRECGDAIDGTIAGTIAGFNFLARKPYSPPPWASHLSPIPSHVFSLGHLPTPIHRWNLPNLPKGTEVWLKRDDLSGMQLSGNKVQKLEFLLADAVAQGADCIITVGGIQSNHCRATAVAAKYLNLDCHLILRTSKVLVDKDPGLRGKSPGREIGGSSCSTYIKRGICQTGFMTLTEILKEKLLKEGRKPYVIPVGGSNSLGTWGYIEAIREIGQQVHNASGRKFDDMFVACGRFCSISSILLVVSRFFNWLASLFPGVIESDLD